MNTPQDEIVTAVSSDGFIRISAVSTRATVERARQIHNPSPVVTAALGRTLSAVSIIGYGLKDPKASVTVRINGGGPAGTILAVSDSSGNVRGYAQNPQADVPKRPDGKLDVGGVVGTDGTLTVIKDLNLKEPYVGSTQLISGEIAEDFTRYFAESEQTPSAVALGVLIDTDRSVRAAGGYILSLLPGAPEELLDTLEANIASTGPVSEILKDGTAADLIETVLRGFQPKILERSPIEYRCYCSRDRVLGAMASIDEKELEDIKAKGETVEITCQFCDEIYKIEPSEIEAFRRNSKASEAAEQADF
jgi:molecular chaperone Hsp33